MDTRFNPRNQGMDEPVKATPGMRGETGLRLPRSVMADKVNPVERAANRGHQRSLCHLEATTGSGDACHSVPDSPTSRDLVPVLRRQLPSVRG